ncbi:hypothetical protein MTR_7g052320 [Medicago truncatula]|uniref:Uncharacterized protein n=1 Tax=Medicago truncatula TaxID=3880 RepID=G7KY29_MEDTR|nr:hypothetical protein MTR_7g052320 [Medicago truncatula]
MQSASTEVEERFSNQLKKHLSKSLVNNGFNLRRTRSHEFDTESNLFQDSKKKALIHAQNQGGKANKCKQSTNSKMCYCFNDCYSNS